MPCCCQTAPDSSGYHFQAIKWQNEFPLVTGIGNLYFRLAFNQSFFTYAALLNVHPYYNHSHSIANSFFLLLLVAECLYISFAYFLSKKKSTLCSAYQLFSIISFPVALLFSALSIDFWGMNISSPTPDIFIALIQFALFLELLKLLGAESKELRITQLKIIIVLASVSVTVKLSTTVYSFLLTLLSLLFVLYKERLSFTQIIRKLNFTLFLTLAILIVWGVRGIIQTGAPLFPASIFWIDTPWSMPLEQVNIIEAHVKAWAKGTFSLNITEWSWPIFVAWFYNKIDFLLRQKYISFSFLLLFAFALITVVRLKLKKMKSKFGPFILAYIPIVGGIIFWFVFAPDLRFSGSIFWLLIALVAMHAYYSIESSLFRQRYLVLLLCILYLMIGRKIQHYKAISWRGYVPIPDKVEEGAIQKKTNSALKVYVPMGSMELWNAPLPVTPDFNPRLRLLGDQIEDGFSVKKLSNQEK